MNSHNRTESSDTGNEFDCPYCERDDFENGHHYVDHLSQDHDVYNQVISGELKLRS